MLSRLENQTCSTASADIWITSCEYLYVEH
jgi:hypothetical protein